jgi:hypothetical protein
MYAKYGDVGAVHPATSLPYVNLSYLILFRWESASPLQVVQIMTGMLQCVIEEFCMAPLHSARAVFIAKSVNGGMQARRASFVLRAIRT